MSNSLNIIVWSKEGCHYCEEVKQFLDEKDWIINQLQKQFEVVLTEG